MTSQTRSKTRIICVAPPYPGLKPTGRLTDVGKRVVYAATGQDCGRSFASGLMSYVEHQRNDDYLRKLSRDKTRGIVNRVWRGQWPGGPIPFGYDRLIVDESNKPKRIIRDMKDGSNVAFAEGHVAHYGRVKII